MHIACARAIHTDAQPGRGTIDSNLRRQQPPPPHLRRTAPSSGQEQNASLPPFLPPPRPWQVTTLFHETGHGLQHMLTAVDRAPAAGINGVEWDAVELPSQERLKWQPHPARQPPRLRISRPARPLTARKPPVVALSSNLLGPRPHAVYRKLTLCPTFSQSPTPRSLWRTGATTKRPSTIPA
jgi:hypothetical protein